MSVKKKPTYFFRRLSLRRFCILTFHYPAKIKGFLKKPECFIRVLVLLLGTSGCSLYLDFEDESYSSIIPSKKKKTLCPSQSGKETIAGHEQTLVDNFKKFLKKKAVKNLTFIEKAVSWSLLQVNARPDISSPTARFQVLIHYKNKTIYRDFQPKKKGLVPYLYGLKKLLIDYKSRHTLSSLAALLDRTYPFSFYVDERLERILTEKKHLFLKDTHLKKAYFKVDQPLQRGESLQKISFRKLVNPAVKEKDYKIGNYLFPYLPHGKSSDEGKIFCNTDLNLYRDFIYVADNRDYPENSFAMEDGKGNVFLAYTAQDWNHPVSWNKTLIIEGAAASRPAVFCTIEQKEGGRLLLMSTKGRDPGQYLFQLIEKGIHRFRLLRDMDELLESARLVYLLNPLRVFYEAEKGNEGQLNQILAKGVSVYHGQNLGKVWAYGRLPNGHGGLILDSRSKVGLSCLGE